MRIRTISISVFALSTLAASALAQSPRKATGEQLSPQATVIDGVLVPVPREIFNTLDRFAHFNWRSVQRPELADWRVRGGQAENALLLGVVIAEGFIAVEAEDAAEVKSVGRAVLRLSRALGVEQWALRRSRSITEHAERNDWPAVRKEWDGVLPDVQQGMKELKSEHQAHLVSLGGWLRGTQALAGLVVQNYSREDASLLRQPVLLDYLEKRLATLSADFNAKPTVAKMREGIRKMRPLMATDAAELSKEKVREIGRNAGELLRGPETISR